MSALTGRATIVYATAWMQGEGKTSGSRAVDIGPRDVPRVIEVAGSAEQDELDLVLHLSGGSVEGAMGVMGYLRQQFSHIRVVVPMATRSTGTMLALGGDEIVMGPLARLGRIGPGFATYPSGCGPWERRDGAGTNATAPSDSKASEEWLPVLRGLSPCSLAYSIRRMSRTMSLMERWLMGYMFSDIPERDRGDQARAVTDWFFDFARRELPGPRSGSFADLEKRGLRVTRLDDDVRLCDAVLSVYHAVQLTFSSTFSEKIIDSNVGKGASERFGQNASECA